MFSWIGRVFAAVLVLCVSTARAEEPRDADLFAILSGNFAFQEANTNIIGDNTGRLKTGDVAGGEIALGGRVPDSAWGWLAAFSYKTTVENQNATSNSVTVGAVTFLGARVANDEDYIQADLAAWRDLSDVIAPGVKGSIGISFADISVREKGTINDAILAITGPDNVRRTFTGAGPKFGLDGTFPVNDNLNFLASGALALLIGEREFRRARVGSNPAANDFTRRKKTLLVPELDVFVGLGVPFAGGAGQFSFGYEVNAFFNALDRGCGCFGKVGDVVHHGFKAQLQVPL